MTGLDRPQASLDAKRAAIVELHAWKRALAEHHMSHSEILSLEMAIAALEEKAERL
ncbi:hypothetical protein MARCHEWKA_01750 [Brevundimonas phage vB_BpoS-Marchewka]|uniref:Uncharacterized protein n=1 Tax=Brevundimonas phage vB_BpoS-Marchewka TaxID=2948604 RepID=A0A9E7N2R4_9CAUD|nr:hypothetical protein MARCHEWKA_01750 [Brevundimonas phage vB_BpoS-Marchewka]UTC29134.1 hypothetical protein BAMBUS_00510 [Brevundimonas phage vB_BpoS-Bambus]